MTLKYGWKIGCGGSFLAIAEKIFWNCSSNANVIGLNQGKPEDYHAK